MNQLNIIKMHTIFTQQDTHSVQVPIDYKPGNTETKTRDLKQGAEISWSKIIQSLFSYHCGIMLEINIKRYLKITHTYFQVQNMTFTKKDL